MLQLASESKMFHFQEVEEYHFVILLTWIYIHIHIQVELLLLVLERCPSHHWKTIRRITGSMAYGYYWCPFLTIFSPFLPPETFANRLLDCTCNIHTKLHSRNCLPLVSQLINFWVQAVELCCVHITCCYESCFSSSVWSLGSIAKVLSKTYSLSLGSLSGLHLPCRVLM